MAISELLKRKTLFYLVRINETALDLALDFIDTLLSVPDVRE